MKLAWSAVTGLRKPWKAPNTKLRSLRFYFSRNDGETLHFKEGQDMTKSEFQNYHLRTGGVNSEGRHQLADSTTWPRTRPAALEPEIETYQWWGEVDGGKRFSGNRMGLNGGTGKARGRSLGFPRVWVCRWAPRGQEATPWDKAN